MKTLEGLFEAGDKLRNDAQVEKAIQTYLEAAELAKQSDDASSAARALHMAGVSAKEAVSRPDSVMYRDAMKYFEAAKVLFREAGDPRSLGAVYRDIAIVNDYAGLKVQALENFQRSIELLEKSGDITGQAITIDKLGLHFYKHNDLPSAKNHIQRALELFRQDPSHGFFQATTWLDLARVLAKAGETEEAISWAEQSLSWYEADHDKESYDRRLAQLYGLLSVLYDQVGRDKLAKEYAQRYEKLLKTFDPAAAQVLRDDLRVNFS